MAELPLNSNPGSNAPIYGVAEIAGAVRGALEERFAAVRVRGELSGYKQAASGHRYFALKEDTVKLDAVIWRGTHIDPRLILEDGLELICHGRITTYPGRSSYQLVVERVELAGAGALLAMLEKLKKKLAAEGLFDDRHKRPLPSLPCCIGVVTSPTGAVIRDICHRLADRFPTHVLIWPSVVQGEEAPKQLITALEGFYQMPPDARPDVLILARGGGSLEDLWCFNDEALVRCVASSPIPLISAVGHETDTTLVDFASDKRAPTPTAAAEMAVPEKRVLDQQVQEQGQRLHQTMQHYHARQQQKLDHVSQILERGLPQLETLTNRYQLISQRLQNSSQTFMQKRQQALHEHAHLSRSLQQMIMVKHHALSRLPNMQRLTMPYLERQQQTITSQRLTTTLLVQHIKQSEQANAHLQQQLRQHIQARLTKAAQQVQQETRMLQSVSYQQTLKRGYAVLRVGDRVLDDANKAAQATIITAELASGTLSVTPVQKQKKTVKTMQQGSLL